MPKISIVIPCYNEQHRLPAETIVSYLRQHADVSVLFVESGSTDETCRVIEETAARLSDRIFTMCLDYNAGKGEAIRQGILRLTASSDAEWFGYWDADLATPLEEIGHLLEHSQEPVKLLMCSRIRRLGATIDRYAWRHAAGRCMAWLIAQTLKMPVYDTQCGAKLIHRSVIHQAFDKPFISRWLFDVELIARISLDQPKHSIQEVPVSQWRDVPGSKLTFKHMFLSLIEIVRIWRRYHSALGINHRGKS